MLSSISSSDRRFIAWLLAWTIVLGIAGNIYAGDKLRHLPLPWQRVLMLKFAVPAALQDYVAGYRDCPVVIVGSSISGALPPPGHERPGICTVAMVGQGPFPVLEVMDRLQVAPRVLFLESNLGFRDSEAGEVDDAAGFLPRMTHRLLPLTSAQGNWLNALWRSQAKIYPNLYRPNMSWEDWEADQDKKPHWDAYNDPLSDWSRQYVDAHIKRTAALIAALESRGTKVIFFESPMAPHVAKQPVFELWAEKAHEAFADHEWVTDSLQHYYMADGMHFTTGSGEDFYELLLSHLPDAEHHTPAPDPTLYPTPAALR